MNRYWNRIVPVILLFTLATVDDVAAQGRPPIGSTIETFELVDSNQQPWSLADQSDFKLVVVAFLGTECPLVKLYADRLNQMSRDLASQSVTFVGINSNQQDSIAEIQHFVRSFNLAFPILKDPGNRVADAFGATRTPEVFVLDQERRVVYRGAIDDQNSYGIQQTKARFHYLRDAINSLLEGKPVETAQTEAVGCIIGRRRDADESSPVTYSNQVSRLLQQKCVHCHRSGEIAPFALTNYSEVAGWAGMIEEVVRERRMPPWHAQAPHGHFKNDIRLTDAERDLIYKWVKAGAPEGDPHQLPAPRQFEEGWQIGKPDLVIPMSRKPFQVKATGAIDYQYFQVDPGFKTDMWVKAAECRPGNRSVVHHIIVGIRERGQFGDSRGVLGELESEWIAATAPGAPPAVFPNGYARLIPAGSQLVFQMHYTPNGQATTDLSEIGLIFADPAEVRKRVVTQKAINTEIEIPPGDAAYRATATVRFDRDVELLSMFPHMHYRGKSFSYELRKPGGRYEKLLNVPVYDFNWQNSYELAQSLLIKEGAKLRCIAHFDNSADNLANPDPTVTVRWGDQTWEEMMIGYFDVAIPVESGLQPGP